MSKKVYDILKYVQRIAMPALTTFIITLGEIFNWGGSRPVAGVLGALAVLLGALLQYDYKKWSENNETN